MGTEAFVRPWQRRLLYLLCAVVVVALGLASRRYGESLPPFVARYAGDTLWALMVFLGLGIVIPAWPLLQRAGIALAFAFTIEVSQLYHGPWLDALRETTLGALVLGFDFVWSDLVCYAAGVSIGVIVEHLLRRAPGTIGIRE